MVITEIIALICIVVGVIIVGGCLMLELWTRMAPFGGVLLIAGFILATTQKTYTYTAVVKDFDGNQTTYTVKQYRTDGGMKASATTMTLYLEDGTKIVVPIQNVIITGQQKGE